MNFQESYRQRTSLELGRRVPSRRIGPSSPFLIVAAIDIAELIKQFNESFA